MIPTGLRFFFTNYVVLSDAETAAVRISGIVWGALDAVGYAAAPDRTGGLRSALKWNLVEGKCLETLERAQPILQSAAQGFGLAEANTVLEELLYKMRPASRSEFEDREYCRSIADVADRLARSLRRWRLQMMKLNVSRFDEF